MHDNTSNEISKIQAWVNVITFVIENEWKKSSCHEIEWTTIFCDVAKMPMRLVRMLIARFKTE